MDDNTVNEDTSLARNRSRRTKSDKTGRLAALQRLKQAKQSGEKLTYEVKDELDIYEEVDEATYSKIVRDRQEDDWIVDDDGSGYVEDGRDIFDEDGGAPVPSKGKKGVSDKRKKNPNIRAPDSKPKNIRSMFAAAAVKAKPKVEKDVNLNEDELLGDIMAELHHDGASALAPAPIKLKKKAPAKAAYNPFSTKVTPKKPTPKLLTPRNINNDMPSRARKAKGTAATKPALDNLDSEPQIMEYETQDFAEPIDENVPMEAATGEEPTETEQSISAETAEGVNNSVVVDDINFDDEMEDDSVKPAKKAEVKLKEIPEMTGWNDTEKGDMNIPIDVQVDSSQLPLTTNENGDQVLRMYWLDAYEDQYKQPGTVYLFGKVWIESAKTHVSACIAVKNIQRRIYILPRKFRYNLKSNVETTEPVTLADVYSEFSERITEKYRITRFKSMKVTKEYAFEKVDVPAESDYLEVRYSAEFPALPMDLKGETFSYIFGANTSSLELFLLDRKMKGPSWIDIKTPQIPNPIVSWCKVEAFVNTPVCITASPSPPAPPPLVVMTLKVLTYHNPRTHQNEVLGAACLVQHKFHADKSAPKPHFQQHFCAIGKPNDCIFPYDFKDKVQKKSATTKVHVMMSERGLLGFLLAKIHKIDPDVIVGHDIFSFDLEVLLHRIDLNKVPHWSRIGRLKRANMPKFSNKGKGGRASASTSGRLVADVMISAKELIRCRSYDLTELVSHVLKEKREEIDMELVTNYYNSSNTLFQLVEHTLMDANYALRMMYDLMVLPLALSITNICGNVISRTLLGGRSERNEYLLLHAFTEKNFVVPDKTYGKKPVQNQTEGDENEDSLNTTKRTSRKKPAYEGGLVLEPKKGFYDKFILLLDFNSLYPSIIQEYNICFTTITRNVAENEGDELDHLELPDQDLEPGILPTEIRKLVQSRKQVKGLMKTPDISQDLLMQYDIRQKALKLTANSMYGCLGFTFSRFYAKPLAALVTGKGREILMKTKDLVETMSLDVIYGDTDSIMINTNSTDLDEVFKLGNKVKNEVNKLYKLLEIDIDGVFKSMLLLKKKKYAALTVTRQGDKVITGKELKGLDIVRRDWCILAKEAGNFVVTQILSGELRETIVENIHSKLFEVGQQVKENKLDMELYHITKSLTKNPEDYPDKKSLPHVQVALRHNSKGGRKMRAGDTVYYVICEDGSNLPASQRAYHPEEVEKADNLKIDTKYYLANQVHPVVSRLCDPIDGTDAAHIAECLGLDPTGYRQAMARTEQDDDQALLAGAAISDEEKYKDCDRLKFPCPGCSKEIIVDSVYTGVESHMDVVLVRCGNQACTVSPIDHSHVLINLITRLIREHVKKYYEGWLHCDDAACGFRTRNVPLIFARGHPVCPQCHKSQLQQEYTDCALYTQLCFYQHIFDMERALSNMSELDKSYAKRVSPPYVAVYKKVKNHVDRQIKQSAYSEVNLTRLFEGLFSIKLAQ